MKVLYIGQFAVLHPKNLRTLKYACQLDSLVEYCSDDNDPPNPTPL